MQDSISAAQAQLRGPVPVVRLLDRGWCGFCPACGREPWVVCIGTDEWAVCRWCAVRWYIRNIDHGDPKYAEYRIVEPVRDLEQLQRIRTEYEQREARLAEGA